MSIAGNCPSQTCRVSEMDVLTPGSVDDLRDIVAEAAATGRKLEIQGGGSKAGIGAPRDAMLVSTARLTGIVDYDPPELVLTARAGTPLAEIAALVEGQGQMLAFEPFDHGPLFGQTAGRATIGGVVAAGVAGSTRLSAGGARDHLLGFKAVSGRGEAFVGGAKVVKNVTGYDLPKVVTGSWGRLVALTEVTLKVLPRPAERATMAVRGLTDRAAVTAMACAMGSQAEVAAAAHLPAGCAGLEALTLFRIQGFGPSVGARCTMLRAVLADTGAIDLLEATTANAAWAGLRDLSTLRADRPLWRVNVAPSAGAAVVGGLDPDTSQWLFDWAGGLVWVAHGATLPTSARQRRQQGATPCWFAPIPTSGPASRPSTRPPPVSQRSRRAFAAPSIQRASSRPGVFRTRPMQTDFSPAQRADPATAASEAVIRKCVHCGFCTATCPTYVLLGDELDSPRGRIYLIKDMLENERTPTPETVKHIDRCLSCLACMTTCPSGVNYMHLVDHARAYIEARYRRPLNERLIRALLVRVLPYPTRFRAALRLARLLHPALPLIERLGALRPVAAMLRLAPAREAARVPAAPSPSTVRRGRVALLQGCAEPVLRPEIRAATVRLLNRAGFDVAFARGEGCCGALVHHMGREAEALAAARRNVDAWSRDAATSGLDAIVITTSGCGTTIKDYSFMLRGDPDYADKAARVSALAKDVCELLDDTGLPHGDGGAGVIVAYQSACSMQHGQGIDRGPAAAACGGGVRRADPGREPFVLRLGGNLQHPPAGHRRAARRPQGGQPRPAAGRCDRHRQHRLRDTDRRADGGTSGAYRRTARLGDRRSLSGRTGRVRVRQVGARRMRRYDGSQR